MGLGRVASTSCGMQLMFLVVRYCAHVTNKEGKRLHTAHLYADKTMQLISALVVCSRIRGQLTRDRISNTIVARLL